VRECVVKALCDVKVIGSKPTQTKNPSMLRVGVSQAECDPRVIFKMLQIATILQNETWYWTQK